jgi:hypothetical protein
VERWNIFWNAFRNAGTLLERFLERVPERTWNVPGTRSGTLERSNLTFLLGTWKLGTFFECTWKGWNVFGTRSGTRVPSVPEHLFQNAQAFRNAVERTWNGEERWNGICKGLWNAWRIYNGPENDYSPN